MISHETICLLNTSARDAHVEIRLYFPDRDPVGPYRITVPRERTLHVRFNELQDPAPVPRGKEYSSVILSDVPIVVQHTRIERSSGEEAIHPLAEGR